jgi:hypothetical protein
MGKLDSRFLVCMEELVWLYALPYDPQYPVVCFDERPCFLIGDRVEPIAMQTGQVRKEHYAYEKLGSCALFAAIEPLTGFRFAQVHQHRTKKVYTLFCLVLAAQFPEAIKIRLVQDNLNTHDTIAFYENLPADTAFLLLLNAIVMVIHVLQKLPGVASPHTNSKSSYASPASSTIDVNNLSAI